jgi:hypothetical protein
MPTRKEPRMTRMTRKLDIRSTALVSGIRATKVEIGARRAELLPRFPRILNAECAEVAENDSKHDCLSATSASSAFQNNLVRATLACVIRG